MEIFKSDQTSKLQLHDSPMFSCVTEIAFIFATGSSLWLPHVRPLNHLYQGKGSKTLGKGKRVTKRNVASRFGQSDGLRVNRNLQHPRKSRVIYPSAPLFCPLSLIFRLLSLSLARPIIPNYALLIPDCPR